MTPTTTTNEGTGAQPVPSARYTAVMVARAIAAILAANLRQAQEQDLRALMAQAPGSVTYRDDHGRYRPLRGARIA